MTKQDTILLKRTILFFITIFYFETMFFETDKCIFQNQFQKVSVRKKYKIYMRQFHCGFEVTSKSMVL